MVRGINHYLYELKLNNLRAGVKQMLGINRINRKRTPFWSNSQIIFIVLLMIGSLWKSLLSPTTASLIAAPQTRMNESGEEKEPQAEPCIPSGDHTNIQNALTGPGSKAVLCPDAVFELSEKVFFTADSQSIYTQGFPTDDSRALLRVVGKDLAIAVSAEGNDSSLSHVSLRNVIIDGNRTKLGIAQGALINFGRGVLGRDAVGHVVEWVKAYEPRGWTVLFLGGPCREGVVRNNEVGPAGRAEYIMADGISLGCESSVVENNTIIDVTDGGIVIFQSPGSLIANNTIRAETRIMFYGISMEDYYPLEGDFTGTRVTGNIIDAAGAMIRRGI
ncbi:MAG: right-handed parallel beta-helix repeat-containing protein, partial [bacterium]